MRRKYNTQLEYLHTSLIHMGALCEEAIGGAAQGLINNDDKLLAKVNELEQEINMMERTIEQLCVRLILHQQPMAGDLRRVTAAQGMVIDLERIGDQAVDISEISALMKGSPVKSDVHIADMARATMQMVTDSINAFIQKDTQLAKEVIAYDDVVDTLFTTIKDELVGTLQRDNSLAGDCLDLLMIAKYFERIGDHAENIAEWVLYYITGSRSVSPAEEEV